MPSRALEVQHHLSRNVHVSCGVAQPVRVDSSSQGDLELRMLLKCQGSIRQIIMWVWFDELVLALRIPFGSGVPFSDPSWCALRYTEVHQIDDFVV